MAEIINLTVPKSWDELSQSQLRFLLNTMVEVQHDSKNDAFSSAGDYASHVTAFVNTLCFFEWSGLRAICRYGDGWLVSCGNREFEVSAEMIASAISHLSWTASIPQYPVRLDTVNGAHAVPADLSSGFSFDNWLSCETLWQAYQVAPDDALLTQMAEILYRKESIKLDPAETLGIFYWWAAVKSMVSLMFPNFFKPAGGNEQSTPSPDDLRRNMDAQIRALTKGDITKEGEILAMESMRALTELDAQAREYDELNRRYPSKS